MFTLLHPPSYPPPHPPLHLIITLSRNQQFLPQFQITSSTKSPLYSRSRNHISPISFSYVSSRIQIFQKNASSASIVQSADQPVPPLADPEAPQTQLFRTQAAMLPSLLIFSPLLAVLTWIFGYEPLGIGEAPWQSNPRMSNNSDITLLIAHPDDEVMFFSPTLQRVLDPKMNNSVSLLCLSVGNYDGKGSLRQEELHKSAKALGISTVHLVDVPELPDDPQATWDAALIADTIEEKTPNTTLLITFGSEGISSHANHKSAYLGAVEWKTRKNFVDVEKADAEWEEELKKLKAKHEEEKAEKLANGEEVSEEEPEFQKPDPFDTPEVFAVFTLKDVPLWRKYSGVLDAGFTVLKQTFLKVFEKFIYDRPTRFTSESEKKALIVSSSSQFKKSVEIMLEAYDSQVVWFRYLWLAFSRYMVVNELEKVPRW